MGNEKRWRAFRIIETFRRQGRPVPSYGFTAPKASGKHFILTELNMMSHMFCFIGGTRDAILRFVFSPLGYRLLWLNHKKREFRTWRRDLFAKWRRKLSNKGSFIEITKGRHS